MGLSKEAAIKQIEAADAAEFIVRTTDEETTYLKNYEETHFPKKIGERVSEIYSQIDDDVKQVTGIEKENGVKTYNHLKTVLTDLFEKAGKLPQLETKIAELEKGKGKPTEEIERLTKENQLLQRKHTEVLETKNKEIESMKKDFNSKNIGSQLDNAFAKKTYAKNVPEIAIKASTESLKSELLTMGKIEDGKLVFEKDGEVIRHPETLIPKTADEIISERHSEILDSGKRKGTGTKDEAGKKTAEGTIIIAPDHITTKAQLSEFLQKEVLNVFASKGYTKGTVRNSPEFKKAYAELGKDLPVE